MKLSKIISPNKNFQSSVNIAFDFGSDNRVRSLIPTDSVLRLVEYLLTHVMATSTQRAKVLTGAYGKGKSHVALVSLLAMYRKEPELFKGLIKAYKSKGSDFAGSLKQFVTDGEKLLPVIVSGSSADMQRSLLSALRSALRYCGIEDLMPKTNYKGAIEVLERWATTYPDTLRLYEEKSGTRASSAIASLRNFGTETYEQFLELYPMLTSGGAFDTSEGADVLKVYEQVCINLKAHGYSGIYVVYDEFSKYLESSIANASIAEIKLLQDFAEKCNRSTQEAQLHLLLIGHKSMSNYIDSKLPKEKVDGWRGVSGRFVEIELHDDSSQAYELISNAIVKDKKAWANWLEEPTHELLLENVKKRYEAKRTFEEAWNDQVIYGCYPLHPVSTYLLPRLSEKVAQNERTLFTFLSSTEPRSLSKQLDNLDETARFVAPDAIFDYFEPLLRREFYTSPIHGIYELARVSLSKVEQDSLEASLIKTISLIYIVVQYEAVDPTRQTLLEVYTDCGYPAQAVEAALDNLAETQSIVYLRQSNSYLRLKESSGVNVESRISDRSEVLKNTQTAAGILNDNLAGKAMFPSRHNEEREITRYFECMFLTRSELETLVNRYEMPERHGDGLLVAVMPSKAEDLDGLLEMAQAYTRRNPLCVLVLPKRFVDISETLFRYEAVKSLREESAEDPVLAEEYEIVQEDYEEVIAEFVASFYRPETAKSHYVANGKERSIRRRSKLSGLLSEICDMVYPFTPVIKNESLNKNVLSGAAKHSRTKILKSLCAAQIEPNLGFVGNGQETAMMRSALKTTGLIEDIDSAPMVNLTPTDTDIALVISTIRKTIFESNGDSFEPVYEALTLPDLGIGMKRGPVIIMLALVLRELQDELQITHKGEERAVTADLLDDIDASPADYTITLLNWTQEMASYAEHLARLFKCSKGIQGKVQILDSIRRWYVSLPQVARNSEKNRDAYGVSSDFFGMHRKFLRALRMSSDNSHELLFEKIPQAFGLSVEGQSLIEAVKAEKEFCETVPDRVKNGLIIDVKNIFESNAPEEASLPSVLADWAESLPARNEARITSNINVQLAKAIDDVTNDEVTSISRIAKACTSLRVEDWNDQRYDDCIDSIKQFKNDVEKLRKSGEIESSDLQRITFLNADGTEETRVFDRIERTPRGNLLRNDIINSLDEMGRAISPEEKRQILFDILRELC